MQPVLSIHENGYFGREKERSQLDRIFDECLTSGGKYVSVSGTSGSGKSSLIESHDWEGAKNCYFSSGKFELQRSSTQPFSAITDALDDVCAKWATTKRGHSKLKTFCSRELKGDNSMLRHLLPKIFSSVTTTKKKKQHNDVAATGSSGPPSSDDGGTIDNDDPYDDLTSSEDTNNNSMKHSFERLRTAVFKLLRSIIKSRPVVILLDDYQWADQPSLDLIQFLIEENLNGLLIIATYRSDEVNEDHPVTDHLSKLKNNKDVDDGRIINMHLSGFSLDDTTSLIAKMTRRSKESVIPLVEVIHQKTGGNPFFIEQFLQLLQREKYLEFSFETLQWEWKDVIEIKEAMSIVSDEVADVVVSSLRCLDDDSQDVLRVASCLGSQIPLYILQEYYGQYGGGGTTTTTATTATATRRRPRNGKNGDVISISPERLKKLVDQHLQNNIFKRKVGTSLYFWAHDKIQQATFSLIPRNNCEALHIRLGKLLLYLSKSGTVKSKREGLVYMAAYQLNRVPLDVLVEEDRIMGYELAELNLTVAKLSIAKSAFNPALKLLRSAAEALDAWEEQPGEKWSSQYYEFCLDLFDNLLETEYTVGNHSGAHNTIQEVLDNAKCREDMFRAQSCLVEIRSNARDRDYTKVLEMCLDILKSYGITFPRNPNKLQKSWEKSRLTKALPDGKLDDLLKMPPMKDKEALCISAFICKVTVFAGLAVNFAGLTKLAAIRSFQLSCAHGINTHTALTMAMYAFALRQQGKNDDAVECANLAAGMLKILSKKPGINYAKVLCIIYTGMLPLKISLSEAIEPLMESYKVGIKTGDVEYALSAIMSFSYAYLGAGLPLGPLQTDAKIYGRESSQFGLAPSIQVQFPLIRQTVMNLRGLAKNPTVLTGTAMDQEYLLCEVEGKGQSMTLRDMCIFRLLLSYVYRDLDTAQDMLERLTEHPTFNPSLLRCFLRETYTGLAGFALYHERKQKRYADMANASLNFFKSIKQSSAAAVPIYDLLLAAKDPSKKSYDAAIQSCARNGLVHLQAMANEAAALYLEKKKGSSSSRSTTKEMVDMYVTRAVCLYEDWGAIGKANALRQAYPMIALDESFRAPINGGGGYSSSRELTMPDDHRSDHSYGTRTTTTSKVHSLDKYNGSGSLTVDSEDPDSVSWDVY